MDELHEHGPIRLGETVGEYPGMPDPRQGRTVGEATSILNMTFDEALRSGPTECYNNWHQYPGETNQGGHAPTYIMGDPHQLDAVTAEMVQAAHDSAVDAALAEHGVYFADEQADHDTDGFGR